MKRHPVRQRYRMAELQHWRDKRGLKFHLRPANWRLNARPADGVMIAALEVSYDPGRYLRGPLPPSEDQRNRGSRNERVTRRRIGGCLAINWGARSARRSACWRVKCFRDRPARIAGGCVEVRPRPL
jgi:hypothetical protein